MIFNEQNKLYRSKPALATFSMESDAKSRLAVVDEIVRALFLKFPIGDAEFGSSLKEVLQD